MKPLLPSSKMFVLILDCQEKFPPIIWHLPLLLSFFHRKRGFLFQPRNLVWNGMLGVTDCWLLKLCASLNFTVLAIQRRRSHKPKAIQPPPQSTKKKQQNILFPETHKSVAITVRKDRSPSGPELPSHSCSVGKAKQRQASGWEFWSFCRRHWLLGPLAA